MVMARKKNGKEKDIANQILDTINFKGLTQNEMVGQDGLIKYPAASCEVFFIPHKSSNRLS